MTKNNAIVRILFLADTHLGFDMPLRPRIDRRRRGEDFFGNYRRVLARASSGEIDLVLHGGDVFYRSQIPAGLVARVFHPLMELADEGVPVCIVPGNHERSRIPFPLLASHPHIHIFDSPRTFVIDTKGLKVALAGFPFVREGIRGRFNALVHQTGIRSHNVHVGLLCMHQAVEGARVGPRDFTFGHHPDVVAGRDIPESIALVLAGHIHRHQVLRIDRQGNRLKAPVLYPGSIERTSFAERGEPKGYITIEIMNDRPDKGPRIRWRFNRLPSRPMIALDIQASGLGRSALEARLKGLLLKLRPDAIVRLSVSGKATPEAGEVLRAACLRTLAPSTMNITVRHS